MRIDVLTLFPAMFEAPMSSSMMGAARARGLLEFQAHDIRAGAEDARRSADDTPYGGGGGMLLRVDVLSRALEAVIAGSNSDDDADIPIILLTPQGQPFHQAIAAELARCPRLILICGHYEGVDERIRQRATREISLGDFVLTGGELPALVVIDAIVRLLPGALGACDAAEQDSFAAGLLEGPHYTRPRSFQGQDVPEVLLSGNHGEIARWRRQQALRRTWQRRPDLLRQAPLSDEDRAFLATLAREWARRRQHDPG